MRIFSGAGVSPGRITGVVRRMPRPVREPAPGERRAVSVSAGQAAADLRAASHSVQTELQSRAEQATGDAKAILAATAMMAADPMLMRSALDLIDGGSSAEGALWDAAASVAGMLRGLGGHMAERAADVLDIRARIIAILRGVPAPGVPSSATPYILVAEDLAPADAATLDPAMVLALVTSGGGPASHTAILARALGLPAVVAAAGADELTDGVEICVDGVTGTVVVDPDNAARAGLQVSPRATTTVGGQTTTAAAAGFDGDGRLADGYVLPLLANVGSARDAATAAAAGAQGIGLLRTELYFLDHTSEPSIQQQRKAYRAVLDAFPGKKVVLRTLDAGADKPLPFLAIANAAAEPNPALGIRGYRTERVRPGVLERQLEAIASAAAGAEAEVWVMAPMISTAEEAGKFAGRCAAAGLKTCGVMVEVPSAALTAEPILSRVDFVSIGTNDLTQYVMAADRQLGALAALNSPWQPAVLQLISHTVAGAAAEGGHKPVGVCGEAAADPALAVVLAGLGVSTLSMTPRSLAGVGAVLGSVSLELAQELAGVALDSSSATGARARVRARLPMLERLGL
ncbi:phosphoenolpyruvate--protein phosphotransferase [Paenarthrobacter sp. Z7-10]|uniref:putative PEP-binding protein n=1 Tax=Paenarthrobacter sp. Z7-10 TaxID=2787635 RepID=UPI0022A9EB6D|nr:putative PEP-binding protein [Paenarthrobacter sp. Z7-10]MCZ2401748.1 phosphoenolpyruvate--protein phosphotransferase [Paenarthrobacter sp. Z7-10]